jgi:hypothetical protein
MTLFPGVILALAFALAYARLAPSVQHQLWDSLAYCASADGGKIGAVNMDHPLGHIVLNSMLRTARVLRYSGETLRFFIIVNAAFGGLAIGLFYSMALRWSNGSIATAVGLSLLFGGANGMWRFSGTGDIYMLVVLTTLLAWCVIVKWESVADTDAGPWWLWSGLLTGVAIATYKVSGLVMIAGCLALWQPVPKRRLQIVAYIVVSSMVSLGGYLGASWIANAGATSWLDHLSWASSQATDPIWGRFLSLRFLGEGAAAATGVLIAKGWNLPAYVIRWAIIGGFSLFLMIAVLRGACCHSTRRRLFVALMAHCLMGAVLVQWWMPWSEKIWLPLYVPLMSALALGASAWNPVLNASGKMVNRLLNGSLCVLGLCLIGFNVWFGAIPQSRNTLVFDQAIQTWLANTKSGDLIVTAGDLTGHLKLIYGRSNSESLIGVYAKPLGTSDRFGMLRKRMAETTSTGNNVYVALASTNYLWKPLLDESGASVSALSRFFAEYEWAAAFSYINDIDGKTTAVYRLRGERHDVSDAQR